MSFEQFPSPEQHVPTMRLDASPRSESEKTASAQTRVEHVELPLQTQAQDTDPTLMDTLRPPKEWAWTHEVSPSLKEAWDTEFPPEQETRGQQIEFGSVSSGTEQARHEGPTLRSVE